GEGGLDIAADAMRADDEQDGFAGRTEQTERARHPERFVEPLQSGLRAFGDISAADQGLEKTKPRGRIELSFGKTGVDVCAHGRHGSVSVRTVPLTLWSASDADGHQCGGGPGWSRAEPGGRRFQQ